MGDTRDSDTKRHDTRRGPEPNGGDAPRTIFEVIAHEHRALEAGFARLHAEAAPAAMQARWRELSASLSAHLTAEREVLHPRMIALAERARGLVELDAAEAEVARTARELAWPTLTASEWLRGLRRLEQVFVRHVELVESILFPVARRAIPPPEARALAAQYAHARARARLPRPP